jgi:UDP-N-acetylmuramoyl-tripeptide--D-alanyl-D-alanine ligase
VITLSLTEIAGSTHASTSPADVPVTGNVVQDSRLVTEGDLFVAIAGERTDGHRHVAAALAAGAAGALVQDASVPVADGADPSRLVVVPDTVAALGDLARHSLAALRGRRRTDVVAVTGSVGKTTTKDLLIDVLSARGELVAPPGSLNNEVGLPLTVLRAGEQTATLVLEMGADRVGNLTYLTSVAPPDVAIVLAVGRAHLGHFGGIDNVARTKSELVTGLRDGGVAVLNLDDHRVAAMASLAPGRVLTFSASGDETADLYATGVELDAAGRASFSIHAPGGQSDVRLALVGRRPCPRRGRGHGRGCARDGRSAQRAPDGRHRAARGRPAPRRLLQRQPGLHARRPRRAGVDRARPAPAGRPRPDARAR